MSRKRSSRHREPKLAPPRRILLDELPRMPYPCELECVACGAIKPYFLGTIVLSPDRLRRDGDQLAQECVGFTAYVRCEKCDAGGPWHFGGRTMLEICALAVLRADGADDMPLMFGETQTFDGFQSRYPTEAEEHILELIEQEPRRAHLLLRLGNIYRGGGRPDLAEPAYRQGVELDPDDVELRGSLAESLRSQGREAEALPHWQHVLKHAREARHMDDGLRRAAVGAAVDGVLLAHGGREGPVSFLPDDPPCFGEHENDGDPLVLHLQSYNLSDPSDFDRLCDCFLYDRPQHTRPRRLLRRARQATEAMGAGNGRAERERAVPRNAACPCGSGRKYKKCCGRATGKPPSRITRLIGA